MVRVCWHQTLHGLQPPAGPGSAERRHTRGAGHAGSRQPVAALCGRQALRTGGAGSSGQGGGHHHPQAVPGAAGPAQGQGGRAGRCSAGRPRQGCPHRRAGGPAHRGTGRRLCGHRPVAGRGGRGGPRRTGQGPPGLHCPDCPGRLHCPRRTVRHRCPKFGQR